MTINNPQKAIFAGGCFWGVQYYFDQEPGVVSSRVGYIGGYKKNPGYEEVCIGTTGHAEAVEITFDPEKLTYKTLLKQFFRMHDPTQLNRQGPDVGDQYRSAIFYCGHKQMKQAEQAKAEAQKDYKEPIVTQIAEAGDFYPAEDYHQKYTERTGIGMCHIPYEKIK